MRSLEEKMATIKEVYKLLKQKKDLGEKIEMFGNLLLRLLRKKWKLRIQKKFTFHLLNTKKT